MLAPPPPMTKLKRDGERRAARFGKIGDEIASWQKRLDSAATRLAELHSRRTETETALAAARGLPGELAARRSGLAEKVTTAEARKAAAADALSAAEGALRAAVSAERDAERAASEAREARAASEARRDAAREAVEAAAQRIGEELETTPVALRDSLGDLPDPIPPSDAIEADVHRLRRQRDALGAVNLAPPRRNAARCKAEHELSGERKDPTWETGHRQAAHTASASLKPRGARAAAQGLRRR